MMVVQLSNGGAFVVEAVKWWDWRTESYLGTKPGDPDVINRRGLIVQLDGGARFTVNDGDTPSPAQVEALLICALGPVVESYADVMAAQIAAGQG
jgi:hypothetical protein